MLISIRNAFLIDRFLLSSRYANEYVKTLIALDIHRYGQPLEIAAGRLEKDNENFVVYNLQTQLHISSHTSISYTAAASSSSSSSSSGDGDSGTKLPLIHSADPSLFDR